MKTRAASCLTSFLEALASERGASLNTIEAYRRDLADYEAHLAAKGLDALQAEASCVRGFLATRGVRSLSAASLARRLSAIRQFHKFLYAEGWRPDDPTLAVEGPRRSRPLPKLLSMAEVERWMEQGLGFGPAEERCGAAVAQPSQGNVFCRVTMRPIDPARKKRPWLPPIQQRMRDGWGTRFLVGTWFTLFTGRIERGSSGAKGCSP